MKPPGSQEAEGNGSPVPAGRNGRKKKTNNGVNLNPA
jgi:hypothetical protein